MTERGIDDLRRRLCATLRSQAEWRRKKRREYRADRAAVGANGRSVRALERAATFVESICPDDLLADLHALRLVADHDDELEICVESLQIIRRFGVTKGFWDAGWQLREGAITRLLHRVEGSEARSRARHKAADESVG